ncbi:MAG: carboxylating nicotinate-nucleotide diphosphorylase [Methanocorpusculum sp.]|uniref:Nicotinate-nucleotide pyrophosphorylase [carboxylating] n=1 Tax=Methanocorpusculum petauri TaxID=3002863 RepID=A0ABT4IID4_9EURY|nr:carboxylating nicotinate-nucleotide diphosphorylase [Methanocorpusculum petauri]MDE2443029.1 carboxylating nicotinate-nucleotide diphosphorylase [Methanocorpusculum sp.]MCZ0861504.1 carboxylating nicotinate-nucleotide diphosphorylase [Methanocorpusculum petauri]MDE2517808.1 carboxylating nicotinate-nucleotide diphosphorylase [Methanocorpusculum sp.]MDE2522364.1 carboxylating nicotinate-nucleotide diphosphorylase [Methanocorpusculum sp.]MDE2524038.1 carboxylating nicotinate-nucleotide diphos
MTTPTDQLLSFFAEDVPAGDITTVALIPDKVVSARIEAREEMILAGVEECIWLFEHFGVSVMAEAEDGEQVAAGTKILALAGSVHAILAIERTALNLLGRMSGIATATAVAQEFAAQVNDHVRVAGTRKTAPGLRYFDKKAIRIGGGDPHRDSLSDAFLIKDTHRALLPVADAVRRAKEFSLYRKVECEVENLIDAVAAAEAGADVLMFDNMTPSAVHGAIAALAARGLRKRLVLEVSGGITPETLHLWAGIDVDRISMGALTHSVRCADVSLEIE